MPASGARSKGSGSKPAAKPAVKAVGHAAAAQPRNPGGKGSKGGSNTSQSEAVALARQHQQKEAMARLQAQADKSAFELISLRTLLLKIESQRGDLQEQVQALEEKLAQGQQELCDARAELELLRKQAKRMRYSLSTADAEVGAAVAAAAVRSKPGGSQEEVVMKLQAELAQALAGKLEAVRDKAEAEMRIADLEWERDQLQETAAAAAAEAAAATVAAAQQQEQQQALRGTAGPVLPSGLVSDLAAHMRRLLLPPPPTPALESERGEGGALLMPSTSRVRRPALPPFAGSRQPTMTRVHRLDGTARASPTAGATTAAASGTAASGAVGVGNSQSASAVASITTAKADAFVPPPELQDVLEAVAKLLEDQNSVLQLRQVEIEHLKHHHWEQVQELQQTIDALKEELPTFKTSTNLLPEEGGKLSNTPLPKVKSSGVSGIDGAAAERSLAPATMLESVFTAESARAGAGSLPAAETPGSSTRSSPGGHLFTLGEGVAGDMLGGEGKAAVQGTALASTLQYGRLPRLVPIGSGSSAGSAATAAAAAVGPLASRHSCGSISTGSIGIASGMMCGLSERHSGGSIGGNGSVGASNIAGGLGERLSGGSIGGGSSSIGARSVADGLAERHSGKSNRAACGGIGRLLSERHSGGSDRSTCSALVGASLDRHSGGNAQSSKSLTLEPLPEQCSGTSARSTESLAVDGLLKRYSGGSIGGTGANVAAGLTKRHSTTAAVPERSAEQGTAMAAQALQGTTEATRANMGTTQRGLGASQLAPVDSTSRQQQQQLTAAVNSTGDSDEAKQAGCESQTSTQPNDAAPASAFPSQVQPSVKAAEPHNEAGDGGKRDTSSGAEPLSPIKASSAAQWSPPSRPVALLNRTAAPILSGGAAAAAAAAKAGAVLALDVTNIMALQRLLPPVATASSKNSSAAAVAGNGAPTTAAGDVAGLRVDPEAGVLSRTSFSGLDLTQGGVRRQRLRPVSAGSVQLPPGFSLLQPPIAGSRPLPPAASPLVLSRRASSPVIPPTTTGNCGPSDTPPPSNSGCPGCTAVPQNAANDYQQAVANRRQASSALPAGASTQAPSVLLAEVSAPTLPRGPSGSGLALEASLGLGSSFGRGGLGSSLRQGLGAKAGEAGLLEAVPLPSRAGSGQRLLRPLSANASSWSSWARLGVEEGTEEGEEAGESAEQEMSSADLQGRRGSKARTAVTEGGATAGASQGA